MADIVAADALIAAAQADIADILALVPGFATLSGAETLLNKTIDGDNNTITNLGTSSYKNNSVTAAKIEVQEAWIAPTLVNGWVNHTVGTYPSAGYFKDTLGNVNLRGLVKNGTIGQNIFVLPAGYRPALQLHIAIASNGAFANIAVWPSGAVQIQNGSNGWVSLDAIMFKAEQ